MNDAGGRAASAASAAIRIVPVDSSAALDTFIRVPERLYAGQRGYVAPLRLERRQALSPKHNPYFQHAHAQFWVAWRGERPVGRISAQIEDLHLKRYGDATGFFGFLDAENDPALAHALTGTAEAWLRAQGMRRAVGPMNLSINEEVGLLVDGFEARPMLMMGYAPPYAQALLAGAGYHKVRDLLAYDYDLEKDVPQGADRMLRRALAEPHVRVRPLDMRRYNEELAVIIDIFNDAWAQNWGFIPFTQAEIEAIAKAMKPLVRPQLVAIAELGEQPAAMLVALPNLYELIGDLKGRLLPLGWAKLLWRLKFAPPRTARVLLMGVRRQYHGAPLGSALMIAMFGAFRDGMKKHRMTQAELSWILEDNRPMRAVLEALGARVYKTYRLYEKALD